MDLERCSCGKVTAFGTRPLPPCLRCSTCGTGLSETGVFAPPAPHLWKPEPAIDGEPEIEKCGWCGDTRPLVEVPF